MSDIMWGSPSDEIADVAASEADRLEEGKNINLIDTDHSSIIRQDSDEDIKITFTGAQKLRWNERIKKIMFESNTVENYIDGSFMGTIATDPAEIIQKHIVTDAIMSVEDYTEALSNCQIELIEYISKNTKGVHILFIINFTAHFLETILSTVYNVGDVDMPNNFNGDIDPSYA